jgi:hypothetical protein
VTYDWQRPQALQIPTTERFRIAEPCGQLFDYVLENAIEPQFFREIERRPSAEEILPGAIVKIGLQPKNMFKDYPEHFWAEIVERRGNFGFVAKVANDIQSTFGLNFGDHIIICIHHIREVSA